MFISYESVPHGIREIPQHFKMQKMCNETVAQFPYTLRHVPDYLKTQEMCNQAVATTQQYFLLFLIVLKYKNCESRPLKWTHGS